VLQWVIGYTLTFASLRLFAATFAERLDPATPTASG
jgi:hypothetical protein